MSVCLFVCSDLEPKRLDGFQPNLARATPWALRVTSKYFFGVDPPGGVIFWKNSKKLLLRHHLRRKLARTARLEKHIQIWIKTRCKCFLENGPNEVSQRVSHPIQWVHTAQGREAVRTLLVLIKPQNSPKDRDKIDTQSLSWVQFASILNKNFTRFLPLFLFERRYSGDFPQKAFD